MKSILSCLVVFMLLIHDVNSQNNYINGSWEWISTTYSYRSGYHKMITPDSINTKHKIIINNNRIIIIKNDSIAFSSEYSINDNNMILLKEQAIGYEYLISYSPYQLNSDTLVILGGAADQHGTSFFKRIK